MNKIAITTGYMGSGSSAATDLISEIKGYEKNNGDFEYILLHCPDGLFDLEDKLLRGNNVIRSDEAIHRFLDCAKTLYDTKNFWPGMYKKRVSNNFYNITERFIDDLIDFKHDEGIYWYYQQIPDCFLMQIKNYAVRIGKFITKNNTNYKPILKYEGMCIAYPTHEEFYKVAKQYLSNLYDFMGYKDHNLLLDQFILPHNLFRINNYFGEETRIIVVDRDPRDIFVLNKYVWLKNGCPVAYPIDVNSFCDYYKKMRKCENEIEDDRILRIHFEDLVYYYEEEVKKIYDLLNVTPEDHILKREKFDPSISINNTQVYKKIEECTSEIPIIEKKLGEYLYDFPYITKSNNKNMF